MGKLVNETNKYTVYIIQGRNGEDFCTVYYSRPIDVEHDGLYEDGRNAIFSLHCFGNLRDAMIHAVKIYDSKDIELDEFFNDTEREIAMLTLNELFAIGICR